MDGLLIIDKPAGITSHDVVSRVRSVLKTKRVGHSGTLDPFATGVMVILVGKATRLAQFIDKDEKEYEAIVRFGYETDTGDLTGTPRSAPDEPVKVSTEDIESVFPRFRGEIKQVPPMYSAKKVAGKKLYEHARRGETIHRDPLSVTIAELEIMGRPSADQAAIRVACSAGTYIRALAEDIGRALGKGAHLTELRRTRAGVFGIRDGVTLDDLGEMEDARTRLLAIEAAVPSLPAITLTAERTAKTKNGLSTRVRDAAFAEGENIRMTSEEGQLIAIGKFSVEESSIKPYIVLV